MFGGSISAGCAVELEAGADEFLLPRWLIVNNFRRQRIKMQRNKMRKALTLTALMLISASFAQAKTLEELLVEKGVITKGEAKMAASAPGTVVYNKGVRWDFSDKKFSGQINTFIQTRYTYTDGDEDFGAKNTSGFDVTKARIIASGTVLDKEFSYRLEGDLGNSQTGSSATYKDAYLTWNACDWLELKMGQFKSMISRQALNNDHALQFADHSGASDYFDNGRQQGLAAKLKSPDMPVWVSAAIFNGQSTGEGQGRGGLDTNHNVYVNVGWDVMGSMNNMEEGDIDGTEDAALTAGVSYSFAKNKLDSGTGDTVTSDTDNTNTVGVNVSFKYEGWGFHGEYFVRNDNPDVGSDVTPQGFYTQLGYFVLPGELELAARYSLVDCDDGTASGICSGIDSVNQVDVSANYFFWRHQFKAQFGYRFENEKGLDGGDDQNTNQLVFNVVGYF